MSPNALSEAHYDIRKPLHHRPRRSFWKSVVFGVAKNGRFLAPGNIRGKEKNVAVYRSRPCPGPIRLPMCRHLVVSTMKDVSRGAFITLMSPRGTLLNTCSSGKWLPRRG